LQLVDRAPGGRTAHEVLRLGEGRVCDRPAVLLLPDRLVQRDHHHVPHLGGAVLVLEPGGVRARVLRVNGDLDADLRGEEVVGVAAHADDLGVNGVAGLLVVLDDDALRRPRDRAELLGAVLDLQRALSDGEFFADEDADPVGDQRPNSSPATSRVARRSASTYPGGRPPAPGNTGRLPIWYFA